MSTVRTPALPLYQLGAIGLDAQPWQRYTEQVRKVWGNGKFTIDLRPEFPNSVAAPTTPLSQLGAIALRRHYLGQAGPQAVAAGGSIAAAATPALITALAPALTAAIPLIGAGIAVLTA